MEKQFGLNIFTLGFAGTIVMTVFTAWGLNKQRKAISDNPELKGQSLSVIVFLFLIGISVTQIAYANYENQDFAIFFNALIRGVAYLSIVIAAAQVKRFNKKEIAVLIVTTLTSILSAISTRPDIWFIALSAVICVISFDQPWQIFKEKSAGVVSFKLLITLFLSTSFWTLYAFAADIWVLQFLSPTYLLIVITTMILWWIYRDKDQAML